MDANNIVPVFHFAHDWSVRRSVAQKRAVRMADKRKTLIVWIVTRKVIIVGR